MKKILQYTILFFITISLSFGVYAQNKDPKTEHVKTNINGKGYIIELEFTAGKAHNHPTMALWMEDTEGNLIQPLFVTNSYGKGVYRYGKKANDHWEKGSKLYKAALPYFSHKLARSHSENSFFIPKPDKPIADAYTAATPEYNFNLKTRSDKKKHDKFLLIFEINQAWDFNDYWHNAKYPDNKDYKASCQPSLIYSVRINTKNLMDYYIMNPDGHGHYSGDNGKLYTDLSTLTSAKKIANRIKIKIKPDTN